MGLRLYGNTLSNNVLRVEAVLRQLGLAFEETIVDLFSGENKKETYEKINGRGQIPALVDTIDGEDIVIVESIACISYLDRFYSTPETSLIPNDKKKAAICFTKIAQVHEKLGPTLFVGSVIFRGKTKEDMIDKIAAARKELLVWDAFLADGRKYLAHDLSLADFATLGVIAPFVEGFGISAKEFPNLLRWYETMKKVPSVSQCKFYGEGGGASFFQTRVTDKTFFD